MSEDEKCDSKQFRNQTNTSRRRQCDSLRNADDSSSSSGHDSRNHTRRKRTSKTPTGNFESQEHLSKALQKHSFLLVDTLLCTESEILDSLVDGCLTEDESNSIAGSNCRKTQTRRLILLMKGRSFGVIRKFLDIVKQHSPTAVELIWEHYNLYIANGHPTGHKCPVCQLKGDVDIKDVIDYLYSEGVISAVLYSDITNCEKTVGRQDQHWDELLNVCIEGKYLHHLASAPKLKCHYTHIANAIQEQIKNPEKLNNCTCQKALQIQCFKEQLVNDHDDDAATCSPAESSHSDDLCSDIEFTEEDEVETGAISSSVNDIRVQIHDGDKTSHNTFEPPIRQSVSSMNRRRHNPPTSSSGFLQRLLFFCIPRRIDEEEDIDDNECDG